MTSSKIPINLSLIVNLLFIGFKLLAQDKISLNNSGGEIGVLVDGLLNKTFINDKTYVSSANPINIGSFTKANGTKTNEIMAFGSDRPLEVYSNVPWTSGTDNINMTFGNKILFPISIWVIYGDFETVVTKVTTDLLAASTVFNDEKVGFDFSTVSFVDATSNPLAPNYYVYHSTGTDPAALKNDIGYISDRINLYYCNSINISGTEYTNAGLTLASKDIIILGSTAQPYVLPHEVGHSFNLAHITGLTGFDNTNMMTQAGGPQMKYFTEGQILRMHLSSNSAINFIYNARPGKLLRACGATTTTATNTCPELQKRIWADGVMPPNISEKIVQRSLSATDEIAMDWLNLSCFEQASGIDERDKILKHKECYPYFNSIINNGLSAATIFDIENNASLLHDKISNTLSTKTSFWINESFEKRFKTKSKDQFIKDQVNLFNFNYISQATKAIAMFNHSQNSIETLNEINLKAYPNPVLNDKIIIEYTLDVISDEVQISIINQTGTPIINKVFFNQLAGTYQAEIPTDNLASGVYLYKFYCQGHCLTNRFVISR